MTNFNQLEGHEFYSRNSSKLRLKLGELKFQSFFSSCESCDGLNTALKGRRRDLGHRYIDSARPLQTRTAVVQAYRCDLQCRREHDADSERLFCYIGIFRLCSCRVPGRNIGRRSGRGEEGTGRNSVGRFGRGQ